jgi:hypothetical protein
VYAMWSLLNSCVSILHDAIASTCKMEELALEKVDGSIQVFMYLVCHHDHHTTRLPSACCRFNLMVRGSNVLIAQPHHFYTYTD